MAAPPCGTGKLRGCERVETLDLLRQWLQTCPILIGEKVQLDFLGRASGWSVSALKESSAKDILGRRSGTVVIKICRRCLPADDRERAAARAALASVTAWAERSAPGTVIGDILRFHAAVPTGSVRLAARGSTGTEDYEQQITIYYEKGG